MLIGKAYDVITPLLMMVVFILLSADVHTLVYLRANQLESLVPVVSQFT